jgi:hypothetical protein
MQVPDTPEGLFEQLAESSLREVYPSYDVLKPRHQKLIRVLHTELTKGELSDMAFADMVCFILSLWRSFNSGAAEANRDRIEAEDEIDTEWITATDHYARLDQYLNTLLTLTRELPSPEYTVGDDPSTYLLMGPGDL